MKVTITNEKGVRRTDWDDFKIANHRERAGRWEYQLYSTAGALHDGGKWFREGALEDR